MGRLVPSRLRPRMAVLAPPYRSFVDIDLSWHPPEIPPRGIVLVWWLVDGLSQEDQFEWLKGRPPGLPLVVVLPPARHVSRAMPLLNYVAALSPKGVLPTGRVVSPPRLRHLMSVPPVALAEAVATYLTRRELLRADKIRAEVEQVLHHSGQLTSVADLARHMYLSRRTLGRHFARAGLPVPSHWLQFGRLLRVALMLQRDSASVGRIALRANYPDGFTLSNQMKRLIGVRPTEVRRFLGWEWLVEAWLYQEARHGSIDPRRFSDAIGDYLPRDRQADARDDTDHK